MMYLSMMWKEQQINAQHVSLSTYVMGIVNDWMFVTSMKIIVDIGTFYNLRIPAWVRLRHVSTKSHKKGKYF